MNWDDERHDRPEPLTIEINGQSVSADMETWRGVQKQILDRLVADERAWEEEQRAAGQVWTAIYWQYHRVCEEECFSLREAQSTLEGGEDYGSLSAAGIRLPFGLIVDYVTLTELPPDRVKEIERELAKSRVAS